MSQDKTKEAIDHFLFYAFENKVATLLEKERGVTKITLEIPHRDLWNNLIESSFKKKAVLRLFYDIKGQDYNIDEDLTRRSYNSETYILIPEQGKFEKLFHRINKIDLTLKCIK